MDRMSVLDAGFLELERSSQQLHVGSVLIFNGPPPAYDELCATIDARLDAIPRYRQRFQRIPFALGRPVWIDDVHYRTDYHVRHTALPSPGTDAQLRTLAGRLMSQPLDLSRPLWEMWLVEGLSGGRWALLNKSHHAMMDGVSGTDLMGVILDRQPQSPALPASSWRPAPEPSSLGLVASALAGSARQPLRQVRAVAIALAAPSQLVRTAVLEATGLAQLTGKAVRLETVLDGEIGPHRSWAWARSGLAEIKEVKNVFGGTVNDVVLTAIAGAFGTFLQARGDIVESGTIRSLVPVSVRGADDHGSLGNQVSAVFADLPVGLADPAARLRAVTAQLSGLKGTGMALGVETLLEAAEGFPPALFAVATKVITRMPQRSISTVTTNIPGPQFPMYLFGREMLEMFPYIPLGYGLRITIGIMSYNGRVAFGVTGDADRVKDLQVLADGIESAVAELVSAARAAGPRPSAARPARSRSRR
jgi:diacylglycerol O-acyltransferase